MYSSLPKDSSLYKYINNNCKWLLLPLTGYTNLVTDSLDKLINLNENITIKASKFAGVSGCYLFALKPLIKQVMLLCRRKQLFILLQILIQDTKFIKLTVPDLVLKKVYKHPYMLLLKT